MVEQVQINTGDHHQVPQEPIEQVVIDPATGQPVPMAPYDEQSMHVDQTQVVGPNIIQNREDFEGVDAEPRSHDFQTHQVFGDIT